jgi:hypothetical protein
MTHHTLTLNYSPEGFKPDRDPLPVKQGDTISFRLGVAPPNSKFKIRMHNPQLFSTGEVDNQNTRVEVLQAASTKYHCQLLDAQGHVVSESSETQPGGGIEPDDGVSSTNP